MRDELTGDYQNMSDIDKQTKKKMMLDG